MQAIVVIPTYNERDNLAELVTKIRRQVPDLHILVVDDNSPDGTGQMAEELSKCYAGKLFVLHRGTKEGLGRAYVAGFRWVLERNYDVVVQMDADLSHDPSYLPAMLAGIQNCDLILGSRYLRGVNVVNWDFKRLMLSKAATRYVQIITGMPFSDATGGFKCWQRTTLENISLERVFSNGYLFQIEMTYKAFRRKFRIAEEQITFFERNLGRSKMNWKIIWEALWGVLRLRLEALGTRKEEELVATRIRACRG